MRILEAIASAAPGASDALAKRLAVAPQQIDALAATTAEIEGIAQSNRRLPHRRISTAAIATAPFVQLASTERPAISCRSPSRSGSAARRGGRRCLVLIF
jgi:hypothetical protein